MLISLIRRFGYYSYYFLQSLTGRKKPLLAGMKLTHDCNLTCRHCPFWRTPKGSISFQTAIQAMQELHSMGVRLHIFEGGEPFLWNEGGKHLEDLVLEAKKYFFCVGVTTNGTFPVHTSADIVWVSIDGLQKTHNSIRGESFTRIMENIKNSTHENIFAHITINSLNWKEIPELIKYLSDHVKGITIQFHYPYKEGEDASLTLDFNKRADVLEQLIEMKKEGFPIADSISCLKALKDNSWRCRSWMIASVEPDGSVSQGCYVKNRGTVSCRECGFAAHAELSLAYNLKIDSILLGNSIFNPGSTQ